ncbi:uncharacterized protein LOC119562757 [Drosophila subpulchrella]|uniref:uncharacterized protein LOC119562757 n=1 Tax=Drosophila subpulchrella TaxID=1486046 RepID=UPI0018A190A0|nr:uncharacterized protein LOC119562757 [Drosophila subpulchrella]
MVHRAGNNIGDVSIHQCFPKLGKHRGFQTSMFHHCLAEINLDLDKYWCCRRFDMEKIANTSCLVFYKLIKLKKIHSDRVDSILSLQQYLNASNLNPAQNPLDYWKISNDAGFKTCVFKYFCVPATSTESERMFSKAGLVVSEKRT